MKIQVKWNSDNWSEYVLYDVTPNERDMFVAGAVDSNTLYFVDADGNMQVVNFAHAEQVTFIDDFSDLPDYDEIMERWANDVPPVIF